MFRALILLLNMTGIPRLMIRLMRDSRVPLKTKMIPVLALLYFISPFDLLHDIIPAWGRIDDILAILLGIVIFLVAAPIKVVLEHARGRGSDDGVRENHPYRKDKDGPDGTVIDGKYRYVEDDAEKRS